MQETPVQPLGQEDPLKEEMATHSSILAWIIPWTREPGKLSPWGHKEIDTTERLSPFLISLSAGELEFAPRPQAYGRAKWQIDVECL